MYRFLRNRFCSRLLGPLVAISAMATLAGCATGPAFQALEPLAPDQAQLYIYRKFDWSMPGQGVHEVTIDGQKEHLRLPHTGWQRVLLTPGTHTVAITGPWGGRKCTPLLMLVQMEAGQTRYIENKIVSRWRDANTLYVSCLSQLQPEAQALTDLAGLKRAD